MSQPICVLCAYYHPRAEPHPPSGLGQQSCPTGQRRLEHELLSLKAAFGRLEEEVRAEIGANDPASQVLPGAPTASPSKQPRVSGSKERQLPINVSRVDLLLPAVSGYVRDPYRDQAGHLSVATVLNEWVSAWRARYWPGQRHPTPDTIGLLDWIIGARLSYVMQQDPAITDFAEEVHDLRGQLRAALLELEPKRVRMWGVDCPRCKIVSQLTLNPEDPDRYRECDNCGVMLSNDEYLQLLTDLVDQHREPIR